MESGEDWQINKHYFAGKSSNGKDLRYLLHSFTKRGTFF